MEELWPLAVYASAVLALIAFVLLLSSVLGERQRGIATGQPFESGIVPVHSARVRIRARFYLIAVLFVIFDLEAVYIVTWALVARDLGWPAYIEISVFIAVLLAALVYLRRVGALDWGSSRAVSPRAQGRAASQL